MSSAWLAAPCKIPLPQPATSSKPAKLSAAAHLVTL